MKKIACIGNITYDIFGYTDTFPKEDIRTNYNKILSSSGGPSYNAACVLDKFGCNVDFYGYIGDDIFSKLLKMGFEDSNINYKHLKIEKDFSMPFSFIIVAADKNTRSINTFRDKNDNEKLMFDNYGDDYDIILTDGKYSNAYLELKKKNPNAITIIDAGRCKDNIIEAAKNTDYIICSEDFANDIMERYNLNYKINMCSYKENYAVMNFLKKYFKNSKVAVTIGKNGYMYLDDDGILIINGAISCGKVLDTTAAGDIFHGAFTYGLANDMSYEDSLDFANKTASLSVTRFGGKDSIPELEEVKNIETKRKILNK